MTTTPTRVVIADDHQIVRDGIRAYFATQPDIALVGEAADGAEAALRCAQLKPDVALIDLMMPGGGVEATRRIKAHQPDVQVVILTSFEDDQQILAAIQAGALSYVLKDIAASALADTVRRAAQGDAVIHPRVAARLAQALRSDGGAAGRIASLSQRERDVLNLIAQGLPNLDIAEKLGIGEKTVKTHVSNLLAKLDVSDRTQAAIYAWRHGLAGD
jgi:two-component system, NarL family, response regulator LiaR